MTMVLKERLKSLLEGNNLSLTALARKSGISKQTLSDWLGGATPRDIRQIKRVARVFNLSVDDLCFGDGVKTQAEPKSFLSNESLSGIFEINLRRVK